MDSRLFIYLYDYGVERPDYDLFIVKIKDKLKIHLVNSHYISSIFFHQAFENACHPKKLKTFK